MKKNLFKFISQIVFVVAGILMFLALIMPAYTIPGNTTSAVNTLFYEAITGVAIMPIILYVVIGLGICLVATKSEKTQTIGSGLLLGAGAVNLVTFVSVNNEISTYNGSNAYNFVYELGAGSIVGLIAFILVVVAYIFIAVDYITDRSSNNNNTNKDIEAIMQWKELEKNGIITNEEFLAQRDKILNHKK